MLILALLIGSLWVGATWIVPERGSVLIMPFAPGRDLQITIWSREKRFIDKEYNHSESVIVDGPLTVSIWAHDRHALSVRQLAVVRLPTWPLAIMALALVGGACYVTPGMIGASRRNMAWRR